MKPGFHIWHGHISAAFHPWPGQDFALPPTEFTRQEIPQRLCFPLAGCKRGTRAPSVGCRFPSAECYLGSEQPLLQRAEGNKTIRTGLWQMSPDPRKSLGVLGLWLKDRLCFQKWQDGSSPWRWGALMNCTKPTGYFPSNLISQTKMKDAFIFP